jgi:hypothetical protein
MMQVLVIFATLAVVIGLIVGLLIARGARIQQLTQDGVNMDGEVVQQWWRNPRGPAGRRYYLRYRYHDNLGAEHHTHRWLVGYDYWSAHPPGSAIAICYSASKPHISAPRYIVDLAREASRQKHSKR